MPPTPDHALDEILALQFTIAWAGEGRCSPKRLGWWETDLVSENGGGDFLARLLPRTHAWASLEAVREAARRIDAKGRSRLPFPDAVRSLYFLGFELDERLRERLAHHKRGEAAPTEVLPLELALTDDFSHEQLRGVLSAVDTDYEAVPHGRRLNTVPNGAADLVKKLAAALLPFGDCYPLPFHVMEQ